MLTGVLGSCDMEDQFEGKKYGQHQLRLQAINHLVMQRETLFEEIKEDLKMTYGALEDVEGGEGGGYSYKSYCLHMMKRGIWCDAIMMKAIASMWSAKITILHADGFFETKIRHTGDLYTADIIVLFNGSYVHGHYISVVRTNGQNFIIGKPERDQDYDRESDRLERFQRQDFIWREEGEEEIIMVPMDIYNMLFYKSQEYDKIVELAKKPVPNLGEAAQAPRPDDLPKLPSLDTDKDDGNKGGKGGKGGRGGKGRRPDDDDDDQQPGDPSDPTTKRRKGAKYVPETEVTEEEIGETDSVCPRCKIDQHTHARLMSHIKKFHSDEFNFLCKECDRGFLTRVGWQSHMKSHDEEAPRLKCPKGCTGTFVDKKSLANHRRKIHPVGGIPDLPCSFKEQGCDKIFHTKSNLKQHEASCKKNPNRKGNELFCPHCGKGGMFTLNKLQEHKRDNHGYR